MKKALLATALIAVIALASCGSTATATGPDELDATIREASDYLNDNIPAGNKIVILNVQSASAALSDYGLYPLQCFEKRFGARVIPAITFPAHTLPDKRTPFIQHIPKGLRAILHAPI